MKPSWRETRGPVGPNSCVGRFVLLSSTKIEHPSSIYLECEMGAPPQRGKTRSYSQVLVSKFSSMLHLPRLVLSFVVDILIRMFVVQTDGVFIFGLDVFLQGPSWIINNDAGVP
jgi:hypothetical protein